jgi:hypothetical protein
MWRSGKVGPGVSATAQDAVPARLDLVCHKDGSTELLNRKVRALPDGEPPNWSAPATS